MKTHVAYISVILLLLTACGYLIYEGLDSGATLKFRDQRIYDLEGTRKQLMASFPALLKDVDKATIVAEMERAAGETGYEKEGCTWVGWVGLKFAPEGRLLHISPNWSNGEPNPCLPEW